MTGVYQVPKILEEGHWAIKIDLRHGNSRILTYMALIGFLQLIIMFPYILNIQITFVLYDKGHSTNLGLCALEFDMPHLSLID